MFFNDSDDGGGDDDGVDDDGDDDDDSKIILRKLLWSVIQAENLHRLQVDIFGIIMIYLSEAKTCVPCREDMYLQRYMSKIKFIKQKECLRAARRIARGGGHRFAKRFGQRRPELDMLIEEEPFDKLRSQLLYRNRVMCVFDLR